MVSIQNIEPEDMLQFSQVDGTQVERPRIAFGQMVRAVHQAVEKDAMVNAQDVSHLVCHDLAASAEHKLSGVFGLFAMEGRIVSGEAVHADPVT